ncbi:MAG TPA: sigma-70 family RNA polymerase sigma factor [Polyangiaceae bacterium]|nr:sigma-70 family RNA polymerase sigma factor [Polyangiaceae bacterium]
MTEFRELVRCVAAHDGEAAERVAAERELFLLLAPRIRLYGLRHLRSETAAADLVQEVGVVLLEAVRAGRIEDLEHIERFVFGTCRHLVSRSRRNERRAQAFAGAVLPLSDTELPPSFSSVDSARLALCLGRVGAREQRVVLLSFQEERSADEIASELGISVGNVRVLRHRAMRALQRCVEGSVA